MRLPFKKKPKATKRSHWAERHAAGVQIALKIVCCIIIGAAFGILPIFINNIIGYLPLITYLIALVLLFAYVQVLARSIHLGSVSNLRSCPRNTDIKFLLRFKNSSFLPCMRLDARFVVNNIFAEQDAAKDLHISIAGKATRDFKYPVRFAHIGECKVGLQSARIGDPIGLFTKKLPCDDLTTIEVTPRLFAIDRAVIQSLELNETKDSMTPFQKEGMDYTGVREYRMGDPMKAIHWKLSSRGLDELFTKLYETSGTPGIEILLSTHAPDVNNDTLIDLYDASVEAAVSFHRFGMLNNLHTELAFHDKEGQLVTFSDTEQIDYRDIIHNLPLPGPREHESVIRLMLDQITKTQDSPGNVVIITSYLSEETVVSMLAAQSRGKRLVCLLIEPRDIPRDRRLEMNGVIQRLADAGIPTAEVTSSEQVEEVRFA